MYTRIIPADCSAVTKCSLRCLRASLRAARALRIADIPRHFYCQMDLYRFTSSLLLRPAGLACVRFCPAAFCSFRLFCCERSIEYPTMTISLPFAPDNGIRLLASQLYLGTALRRLPGFYTSPAIYCSLCACCPLLEYSEVSVCLLFPRQDRWAPR